MPPSTFSQTKKWSFLKFNFTYSKITSQLPEYNRRRIIAIFHHIMLNLSLGNGGASDFMFSILKTKIKRVDQLIGMFRYFHMYITLLRFFKNIVISMSDPQKMNDFERNDMSGDIFEGFEQYNVS